MLRHLHTAQEAAESSSRYSHLLQQLQQEQQAAAPCTQGSDDSTTATLEGVRAELRAARADLEAALAQVQAEQCACACSSQEAGVLRAEVEELQGRLKQQLQEDKCAADAQGQALTHAQGLLAELTAAQVSGGGGAGVCVCGGGL